MDSQLSDLRRRAAEYATRDGRVAEDDYFFTEQNARLVKNAEQYYRTMFQGRISSWNLRDRHMAETLDSLMDYFTRQREPAKIVVWEHNSHLGDARATAMGDAGELNVGQFVRERYGRSARLIGFSTYEGTVTAASDWDGPAERKRVRPGLPGSYEALFHDVGLPRFLVTLTDDSRAVAALREPRLQRAIGSCTVRTRNARAITSKRRCRASSMLCCTSIGRGGSSRWTARQDGRPRNAGDLPLWHMNNHRHTKWS